MSKLHDATLVKGSYIKMQPHTTDFVHLSNPKSVLESALIRGFTCLSAGDTIMIMHEGKKFYIDVLETKPVSPIRVNDTDCEVDFAPPLDYKEPEKVKPADKIIEKASMEVGKKEKRVVAADDEEPKFRPFMGVAKRLDGSPVLTSVSASEECKQTSCCCRKAGKVVFGFPNAVGKREESKESVMKE
ncbi:hypothetical protein FEM48_Zijuj04G0167900 [Ziziphus jujuba var. spinosa]|uniref:Ubiquitin fusion degradation protein UFD1 N-terminal subdomain 2 domain-containing protein n=1 Tax=Ziziphus jujuba var. spinosa TaxID=714518 RepID=A0A978VL09_ZIZJJ|nr:ubiquitin fusion degradation protein 1 homolog [Ziziphus jujuba var. spinosa]KAH7533778.1 hypothetical protein FEM48_Zijuj04G0167900 [Ziziphus jujuba var. spinosa]